MKITVELEVNANTRTEAEEAVAAALETLRDEPNAPAGSQITGWRIHQEPPT